MVGKCRGLPLAIVILSGLLLHNMSYDYWSKVKEHIWRKLKEGGSFQIEEILSLSYNDLSPRMRDCFLYLARYPEDDVIDSTELKLLWIAEEFISEAEVGDGVVMEDLAEDYLNELINRNLLQVEGLQWNTQVELRVHDLVRDLAVNKAKEDKFLVVFNSSKHHQDIIHFLEGQPRHVINNGICEYLKSVEHRFDCSYLRSLTLSKYFRQYVEIKEIKLGYTRFKNLKVLDMRSVNSERIPEEIGYLVLLKYLGLMAGKYETEIPRSIGKLKKLQTLLGSVQNLYTIPIEMCELHDLRYVDIKIKGSWNIGSHQTKLHTIGGYIQYKEWIKIDTVNLTNLHSVGIEAQEEEEAYTLESVANLTSLQKFSLSSYFASIPTIKPLSCCNRLKSVNLIGTLKNPSELYFLPDSVTDLSLSLSWFTEDPMPILGSFSNLTTLEINNAYDGNKMVCSQNAFPSLQLLRLYNLRWLKELEVGDGAFPSLKQYEQDD